MRQSVLVAQGAKPLSPSLEEKGKFLKLITNFLLLDSTVKPLPLGFDSTPTIKFTKSCFPHANTCSTMHVPCDCMYQYHTTVTNRTARLIANISVVVFVRLNIPCCIV